MPSGNASFEHLSWRHRIKILPVTNCSVEECSLAVGKAAGFESILSVSRMNCAVVIFLDTVEKLNSVVQSGVITKDTFTPVMRLVQPARKNIPPLIKADLLLAELLRKFEIVAIGFTDYSLVLCQVLLQKLRLKVHFGILKHNC